MPSTLVQSPADLASEIKRRAGEVGFDLVGIASAEPSRYRAYLRRWLDEGRAGTMDWLARRFDERTDPAAYLPGARSVVCVAINYHVPLEPPPESPREPRLAPPLEPPAPQGRVARYALGDDYHELIKTRLHALADWLRQRVPGTLTRSGVDTVPVMEKELAARAGIGWVGKNTCVINPHAGSWLLLGEILTTLDLPPDEPAADHCGNCTRCLDACPTGAITAPYQLDARRCISYLTIERRDPIAPDLEPLIGDWLYGCDVCQDVCPFNRRAPVSIDPALAPRLPAGTLDLRAVSRWQPAEYSSALRGSAMKRVKLPVLQRNARVVLKNLGAPATAPARD